MQLQQGSMSVLEYASKFMELSRFAPAFVADERLKVKRLLEVGALCSGVSFSQVVFLLRKPSTPDSGLPISPTPFQSREWGTRTGIGTATPAALPEQGWAGSQSQLAESGTTADLGLTSQPTAPKQWG